MSCAFIAESRPAMSQLALPLGMDPDTQPRRIVVGQANAGVIEAFDRADGWPFRTAILFGPPRSGKSLLAHWFVDSGRGDAVDDADRIDETDLFHRWNRAQEGCRPLLLTTSTDSLGTAEPDGWRITLPDLASRLGAALRLDIGAPDDAMMAELIAAHAEARGLAIGDEGARYLATRGERSHLAAERIVATIDRLSLERKHAPGPAIWREALEVVLEEELSGPSQPRLL
jgi:chromosomal replication initiation ATPase DnaA